MSAPVRPSMNMALIKGLTYVMFAMFAMTTDSVGIIIPQIIKTFKLSLTAAGTFQYATMAGIALAGFLLGHLADRYGRKTTIVAGLTLFAASSYLFLAGSSFLFFCVLMALSGAKHEGGGSQLPRDAARDAFLDGVPAHADADRRRDHHPGDSRVQHPV